MPELVGWIKHQKIAEYVFVRNTDPYALRWLFLADDNTASTP